MRLACSLIVLFALPAWSAGDGDDVIPITEDMLGWSELAETLRKAEGAAALDAAFQRLAAVGQNVSAAREALQAVLAERWQRNQGHLVKAKLDAKFKKLAAQREELDAARKFALTLIEDETAYFYPYNPPDVDPKKAAEYPKVQAEVDARVRAVLEVWTKSAKVKLAKPQLLLLEEQAWLWAHRESFAAPPVHDAALPEWARWLPTGQETFELRDWPLVPSEAAAMARDRAVSAYNETQWGARSKPKHDRTEEEQLQIAQFPAEAEREQVRVTNEYRIMMGRPALTWDARLQASTRHHSDYMARTGEFGHNQNNAATRTPFQRMALAGYVGGVSENCAMGMSDPKAALESWKHSSGHHRNLLMRTHKQMAAAVTGNLWTQNFGVGPDGEKAMQAPAPTDH
ncbi:MAG: CAP domain-containing protein [Planctomycetota bacterium]